MQWQHMSSAPRDGTIIETRCTYGVAPWYGLHKWDGARWVSPDGLSGVTGESTLAWRPHNGDVAAYIDPTNGFQDDPKYWRQAVAVKYGLPKNHFEKPETFFGNIKAAIHMWLFS